MSHEYFAVEPKNAVRNAARVQGDAQVAVVLNVPPITLPEMKPTTWPLIPAVTTVPCFESCSQAPGARSSRGDERAAVERGQRVAAALVLMDGVAVRLSVSVAQICWPQVPVSSDVSVVR